MKSWLGKNNIEMYLTHNERKSVIAERFIRTLKNKIYKYMTSVSKNVYIDKLDDIVTNYNKTYQCTIKIKPVDVKSNTYIDFVYRYCHIKHRYWHLLILMRKKLLEHLMKKNCKKQIKRV